MGRLRVRRRVGNIHRAGALPKGSAGGRPRRPWNESMSRGDKLVVGVAVVGAVALALVAAILQVRYAEVLFFKRLMATLAGCF